VIAAAGRQLYWNRVHHLSVAGNHVVAGAIAPMLEPLLARSPGR
jgi:hypothetical protein